MRRSVLLILLSLAIASPATTHAQPAGPDAADVRYRAGNVAFKQKRYVEAKAAYEDAFRLKQTFDIAVNLGFAEMKLELWRDAATHLSFALRNWAPTGKAESRVSAVEYLAAAKEQVATLAVTVTAGAEVMVDGKRMGTAPVEELFVDPGTHTIGARRDGYTQVEQTALAERGKTLPVALTLVAAALPPPSASATPLPSSSSSSSAPPAPPIASAVARPAAGPPQALIVTSGVLAAAGLGAGIGLTVAANGKASDEARLQMGRSACFTPGANAAACATLNDAASSKVTLSNAAVSTFIGGSAFALVTAGLGIWAATSSKAAPVRVVPTVGADRAGLSVVGVW